MANEYIGICHFAWYKPILAARPDWTLTAQYIDEGITGTSAEKRPHFMQMIKDAKDKKFNMIITREVSRFARNTVDTLQYTRLLKEYGVEVFFINDNEDCQRDVVDEIDMNDCTPSHDQTLRMRKMYEEGKLTPEAIQAIMSEQKPNQREKIVLRGDRVRQLIPKNISISQTEEFVCKALEHYNSFLRKRAERDSR